MHKKNYLVILLVVLMETTAIQNCFSIDFYIATGTVTVGDANIFIIDGSITIGNTTVLNGSDGKLQLAGNWDKGATGIFNCGTSTVTYYGTGSSTISGNTTYYCLECVEPGKELVFTAGSCQTVSSKLTITGSLGNEIKLRSSSTGVRWNIDFTGSNQQAEYIEVKDSEASQHTVDCRNSTNCVNSSSEWVYKPCPPGGLTQLAGTDILSSMEWTESSTIISSFSQAGYNANNPLKYHIEICSFTNSAGNNACWSTGTVRSYGSGLIAQGTTGYQWEELTETATYWWRVWSENEYGRTSSTTTVLASGAAAKLGWEVLLSVMIIEDTYAFGEVALGSSSQTITAIQIKNDGNVKGTYSIRFETTTAGGSPWYSAETTTGYNQMLLKGVFHPVQPAISAFNLHDNVIADNEYRAAQSGTSGRYSVDGSQTGVEVPANEIRKLWLRLDMPASSSTANPQEMRLYIQMAAP